MLTAVGTKLVPSAITSQCGEVVGISDDATGATPHFGYIADADGVDDADGAVIDLLTDVRFRFSSTN